MCADSEMCYATMMLYVLQDCSCLHQTMGKHVPKVVRWLMQPDVNCRISLHLFGQDQFG